MDRLPPYALESEQALIGCCLLEPKTCIPEAQMIVTGRDFFYDLRCQIVWETICGLEFSQVNVVTVFQKLKDGTPEQKKVAVDFLNECQDRVTSVGNLPAWLAEIQQKKIARDILAICARTTAAIYEGINPLEILEGFESQALAVRPSDHSAKDMKALLREALPIIEARSSNWDLITGLTTGIPDLDKKTDGLHAGEFIVIAAQTSCGKTALALNIAVHNAMAGVSSAFCSAEMLPVRLALRALCSEARVNVKKISEPDVMKILTISGKLGNSPIRLESVNGYTIGQVRALGRRLKQQYDIKLLVVENVQLLNGQGDNREQRIANVSSGLKGMALELNIPVIGLSQLNDDDRLRESRAIGHDADSVWLIKNDGAWQPETQPAILCIEKCRDGETGQVPVTFLKTITRFESAARFSNEDVPAKNWQND